MAAVREEKPNSLSEFITIIEGLQGASPNPLWFRGSGKTSYSLIPTIYRHPTRTSVPEFAELERQLVSRFRQRSLPYEIRPLNSEWDVLFFMQHYGVPTRLLDWSENPLTALHFALMSAPLSPNAAGILRYPEATAVWILNPVAWNEHALSHVKFVGRPLTPEDVELNALTYRTDFAGMNNFPVALYGAYNSPRIVAQQGVFIIFGQDRIPMDQLYNEKGFPVDCLIKVVIKATLIKNIRNSLLNMGVTESVIFPDLGGLAQETRRICGFET